MRSIRSSNCQPIPLDIVGSTSFGRYPKISAEETFNMLISDGFLVPSAGYTMVQNILDPGIGRGLYASSRAGKMFSVVNNVVYSIDKNLTPVVIGNINTFEGDVYIAENNGNQIAFCDLSSIYIYNYETDNFQKAVLPQGVVPGYVTFQDGYFIVPDTNSASWYLSAQNDGTNWLWGVGNTSVSGAIETKPDKAIAAIRFPGRGNLLLVFGKTVTEMWYDVGAQLFPYQKSTAVNIDFGCLSASTIAAEQEVVVWLGQNEKAGPTIVYTTGGDVQRLSNDGIDFRLANLVSPQKSYAFFFKQDGHLLYQITFYDEKDNLTLQYDFNTQKFFTLTDEYMNYHIARRIAFFNDNYYFVSANNGNLYRYSSDITTYDGKEIPRVRVCRPIRLPDSSRFIIQNLNFTMEMGADTNYTPIPFPKTLNAQDGTNITTQDGNVITLTPFLATMPDAPRVDLSISKNGGVSFSNYGSKIMNRLGYRQNRVNFWGLGIANDLTIQLRFYGPGRFVATNGEVNIYQ